MYVKSITLENFRNYRNLQFQFSSGVNVINGKNAQGKTNLLEAIYYLSCGKSHRQSSDRELISFHADNALNKICVFSGGRDLVLEASLSRDMRKRLLLNGVPLKSISELSGKLRTVLFSPDDLYLVKNGAKVRLRFLDGVISQLRPRYVQIISEYAKVHERKTKILRDDTSKMAETLDIYNERLAAVGSMVISYRASFLQHLLPEAARIHSEIAGGTEELSAKYRTDSTVMDPLAPRKDIEGRLLEHLERRKNAELDARLCLIGPHKDDIEIFINGMPARTFASQGQMRTAALALKLSEREIHFKDKGEYPVLLLDDVFSELDEKRQAYILEKIEGGQVFITSCEEKPDFSSSSSRFFVKSGSIMRS